MIHGGPALNQKRNLVTEIPGPKSVAMMQRRKQAVSAGVGGALPVFAQAAGGSVLLDIDGNTFIDLGSGIAVTSVGNSAETVVNNVKEQVELFTHTCFMVTPYEKYIAVCEKLNELTPGSHEKRSALFNSGAEAVENAIKVARAFTKRQAVVAFEHGYHGRTNLTMALTAKSMPYKHSFGPFAPEIYRMPMSYPYHDNRAGVEVAKEAISKMEKEIGGSQIAAIIVEPIQGEGGFIVPAAGFLPAIAEYAKANGIVFIADEIQTGFCRTGAWFASEHENLVPDLITTAKGLAGGLPLAGITGRAEMMDSVHVSGLGGTYGGNPIACAAALGSIAEMERYHLIDRAKELEQIFRSRLTQMQSQFPAIGDIRGKGAMMAIELIHPDGTPNAELVGKVSKYCHQNGVIVLTAGTYGNVIRFLPPLTISDELLHEGLDVVAAGFKASI
jgi:4-aminobutyrate aminotransferase/(S)-3-amino-2-methylpropionate transaminase